MVVNQEDKQESPNEFRHSNRDSRDEQNGGYKDVSMLGFNYVVLHQLKHIICTV